MLKRDGRVMAGQLVQVFPPDELGEGFEILYERYVDKVYQKCLKMTCDVEDAQDFTQDIFLKVFAKFNTFQHRSTFSTWLYAISHNYCVDKLKLSERLKTEPLSDLYYNQVEHESTESDDNQLDQIAIVLERMPQEEVMLLKLKHEQGLSIKEIGQRLTLKESAVKMRLRRSRQKLARLYDTYRSAGL